MFLELFLLLLVYIGYKLFQLSQFYKTHWQNQGVKVPKGTVVPLGNAPFMHWEQMRGRKNVNEIVKEQYNEMKGEKFYGTYMMSSPVLVFQDPELIKTLLVKDFSYFVDRNGDMTKINGSTRTDEIWDKQMTGASGDTWKNIRSTFSPIFTSGKMKSMVPFIHEINSKLMDSLALEVKSGSPFDLKQKFGRFSMDTLASCAFGLDGQSFTNPNSEFVQNAREVFRTYPSEMIKFLVAFNPVGIKIFQTFKIPIFKPKETKFFDDILVTTIRERIRTKSKRNDLIDMMLAAMKDEETTSSKDQDAQELQGEISHKANKKDIDELTLVATAIVILIAGYDTTGQTLSYCTYELALNKDIQSKLQEEIDETFESLDDPSNGFPDYTTIQSMEYLDMVLHETLRKYPALGFLQRACVQDYTIPGTDIKIKKGEELFINVAGIHADSKYYPEPERFNPDNFTKEAKEARHPFTFFGFGQGPRNCIGMRFALLEAKIALVSMLRKYNVVKCKETVETIRLDPAASLGAPKDPLIVKLEERNM